MFTVIGGNPFIGYTGTMTYTGLRVVGVYTSFEEMENAVKDCWDDCGGLILVLYNGEELEMDENGRYVKP